MGAVWQVAASYLGSHTDRLWNQVAINPGVFLGLGPCTLHGVFYPTCSTNANLNQRRVFSLSGRIRPRHCSSATWTSTPTSARRTIGD